MTVRSVHSYAPRAPRFTEILTSPVKMQHKQENSAVFTHTKPLKTEMEQAKQDTRNMTSVSPMKTETGGRLDEVVTRRPEGKATSPLDRSKSHATAGSSREPSGKQKSASRPKLPSLSSSMTGDDLDIAFGSLILRPEMRPICKNRKIRKCAHVPKDELDQSPIYLSQDPKDKPICEACIERTSANSVDAPASEHSLRPWKPKGSVQFEKFLWERRHGARLHFGPKELLGREWLYSDHSFAPSSTGNLTVRFNVVPEPGTYRLAVCLQTYVSSTAISKDTLGKSKHATIQAGTTWIGSLGVGVQTVYRDAPTSSRGVNACLSRLPEKIVEVKITKGTQNEEQILPPGTVEVSEGQAVEVSVRHWHDKAVFTKRSPFKWWLDTITLIPEIESERSAPKEDGDLPQHDAPIGQEGKPNLEKGEPNSE